MNLWRQITHGFRALTQRSTRDKDVDDEVRHYFEETTRALVAGGLSADEARRAARLELGPSALASEDIRAYGWESVVSTAVSDLRYAMRGLRASPGFAAVTVLTLAIGIGWTTAIFSAVSPILFEPLPYPQADRVVSVLEFGSRSAGVPGDGTFAMYHRFADRSRTLEALAVFKPWQATATGDDKPERLVGQRVSAAYFHVLGVEPSVGRSFEPSEDRWRGPNVVILSDGLWRRRFSADASIVGRQITLDDNLYTVVGVMPAGFENVLEPEAEAWALLQYDASIPPNGREWGHHLRTIGRLRDGVRAQEAAREVNEIGHALLVEESPASYDPATVFSVAPLRDELTRGVRPALLVILGAVTLVMLIASVNVTNLLLARNVRRRGEFALRSALGASQGRLTRQLLTESLLLAAFGGMGGFAVAALGVRALVALAPLGLPRINAITVSNTVFGFGFCLTTLIGLAVGLISARQAVRGEPRDALQHGARHTTSHARTRSALVVTEVALALVLLVTAGLLFRSMERLLSVPPGFESSDVVTMRVHIVGRRFDEAAVTGRFLDDALGAVRRVPGVITAGFTDQLPMSGDRDQYGARFEDPQALPGATGVYRYAVSPGYLEAMRIPLRRGRFLDERDRNGTPLVALVSQSLADSRLPGQDPIGHQLRLGPAGPFTIVGVVGDVRQLSLTLTDSNAVYMSASQSWFTNRTMSLVVHARGNAAALAPAVREAIWSVDKDQPVMRVATMDSLLAGSAAERRFTLILFEAFALAALMLAAAGIYGVLAGSVAERTREIGVRAALGASRAKIIGLVVRQGMVLASIGVVIGLAAAGMASHLVVSMLFSVSALDAITYVGVVALLAVVSGIACSVPAWRAARVDPAITLRAE